MVKTNRNNLILDYYNANPTSMELAIKNFENIKDKNKGLILGDMLELGKDCETEHKKLLEYISSKNFKKVYLIGPRFYKFKEEYGFNFFNTVDDFAKHIVKNPE